MSTTIFTLAGVAQAAATETTTPTSWSFTYAFDGSFDTVEVPAGYCAIDWTVIGGSGGAGSGSPGEAGAYGGKVAVRTDVEAGTVFTLAPGGQGDDSDGLTDAPGGNNAYDPYYTGDDGYSDGAIGGGGGGGASVVEDDDGEYIVAYGGDGGDDGSGDDGDGAGFGSNSYPGDADVDDVAAAPGDGSISGVGVACAPAEPSAWLQGDDGKILVYPTAGQYGDVETTGYEYKLDNGTWTALTTATVDGEQVGTINGLTNGTTYSVQLRATAANGTVSDATDPQEQMAYKPIGAPANVVATKGASSIVITWDAPTTAGSFPVAGYVVGGEAVSATGDGGSGVACETAADVRRCVITAEPGWTHTFGVTAVDTAGNPGLHSASVTVSDVQASVVPATVPTKDGDLVRPAGESGSIAAGSQVHITGGGYLPGSTVTLIVYSDPQVLTTTVADASGNIDVTVTVPAGLASGNHTLVAAGVDANGNTHYLTLPITVTGGTTGSGGLAYTGASVAVPAVGGLAALAVGGGLVLAGRRKRAAE